MIEMQLVKWAFGVSSHVPRPTAPGATAGHTLILTQRCPIWIALIRGAAVSCGMSGRKYLTGVTYFDTLRRCSRALLPHRCLERSSRATVLFVTKCHICHPLKRGLFTYTSPSQWSRTLTAVNPECQHGPPCRVSDRRHEIRPNASTFMIRWQTARHFRPLCGGHFRCRARFRVHNLMSKR